MMANDSMVTLPPSLQGDPSLGDDLTRLCTGREMKPVSRLTAVRSPAVIAIGTSFQLVRTTGAGLNPGGGLRTAARRDASCTSRTAVGPDS